MAKLREGGGGDKENRKKKVTVRGEGKKQTEETRKRKWKTHRGGLFTQITSFFFPDGGSVKRRAARKRRARWSFSQERTRSQVFYFLPRQLYSG